MDTATKPLVLKQFIVPLILAVTIVVLFLLLPSAAHSQNRRIIERSVHFAALLLASLGPDMVLKLLEKYGILDPATHEKAVTKRIIKPVLGGIFAGGAVLVLAPILDRWLATDLAIQDEHNMPILVVAAVILVLVMNIISQQWSEKYGHKSQRVLDAQEELALIRDLKAQGCDPGELLERLNAFKEMRAKGKLKATESEDDSVQ